MEELERYKLLNDIKTDLIKALEDKILILEKELSSRGYRL